ncbi:MAG: hypothetical protein H8E47_07610 [Anaerolineales bacterium]|nr:hypothetical protein [Anaerolineales bacterium]
MSNSKTSWGTWKRRSVVIFAILALVVAPWQSYGQSPAAGAAAGASWPDLRLLTSSEQGIVLELRLPAWEVSTQKGNGVLFDEISVPGFSYTSDPGTPRLPVKFVTLGIPPGVEPQVQVLEADGPRIETGYRLAANSSPMLSFDVETPPSMATLTGPPALKVEPASGDALYPAELAQVVEVGRLRSQSFVQIRLNPFQYHPQKHELHVYDRLQIAVKLNAPATGLKGDPVDEGPFESALQALLLNYAEAKAWRGLPPPPQPSPSEGEGGERLQDFYTGIRFRIEVSQDGLYELDRNMLQAEDPDIINYLLSTFQLFEDFNLSAESEVALEIVDLDGDDHLDFKDLIRFYGRIPDEEELQYTGTRVYWLAAGREAGKRMATRSGAPGSGAIPPDFPTTVHVEENHKYYWNLPELGGSDTHWYWVYLVQTDPSSPLQRNYLASTPNVSSESHQATVRAKLVNISSNSNVNPDHRAKLYLSNVAPATLITDQTWDGQIGMEIEGNVTSSKLNSGANTIRLEIYLQPGVIADALYVDWFEVDYRRAFEAQDDALTFTRPTGYSEYEITGFSAPDVGVYDITDPPNPVRLTDTQVDWRGTLRFSDATPTAEKYIAALLQKPPLMEPDSLARVNAGADLRAPANGANYLIITHADFTSAANQLATHRATDFTAKVVQVQDVYNQFGNSVLDPEAIHDFLAYAIDNWSPSPQYVLLMGDGTYDYRDYLGEPRDNYVPPYQAMVDPWLGETADENYYAAVSGADIVPDLAVGRAPVNTLAEANAVVAKIIAYEGDLALQRLQSVPDSVMFVADNYEPARNAGNFPRLADGLATDCLPDSYTVQTIYYGETHGTAAAVKSAIISNINQGQRFGNYIGHAGVGEWADEGFFAVSDVGGLSNANKFPVVLGMTCLEGSFQDAVQDSVAEQMVRGVNKGAIASWSPTGLGVATGHDKLSRGFYNALFQENARRLGAATVAGKVRLYNSGNNLDLIHTFTLLGDPATDTGIEGGCQGDLNDDGDVNIVDIMLVATRWRTSCDTPNPDGNPDTPNYEAQYDLDGDCDIDIVDIMRVVARWGGTCEAGTGGCL